MSIDTPPVPTAPLAGLTVLDLTWALAGPFATFLLAGLGARVIKIENPDSPDPCRENPPYLGRDGVSIGRTRADDVSVSALNRLRGKYGITLNLKQAGARDVFADLLRQADIVVENFSAGTLNRLGVGYSFARSVNPRVIYCSISGFGAHATNSGAKAMDSIIQALSGLMMTSGDPGDPPVRVGVPVADLLTPVFGVVGILSALRQRESSGVGQHVDVSMLGVLTSLVAAEPFDLLEACGLPQRTGRVVPRLTPFGIYESADGHVAICAPTEQFARGVFATIGHPEFGTDPRFATRDARVAHVAEINAHIEDFTRTLPTADLLALLERHHVPAAPVRSPADAIRDPRVRARGETQPLEHPEFGHVADVIGMGIPITFSESGAGDLRAAPCIGQDNALVYGEWLGYGSDGVARMHAAGII
ncbi:MAG TPA: CoA transferase [Vicinamibacterales bacterium]|jgi:crotonobetainyl-CoA:carnitine CoA-transferase CaiB-like acyl-CoA transferase